MRVNVLGGGFPGVDDETLRRNFPALLAYASQAHVQRAKPTQPPISCVPIRPLTLKNHQFAFFRNV
jgi:hypothetical protein